MKLRNNKSVKTAIADPSVMITVAIILKTDMLYLHTLNYKDTFGFDKHYEATFIRGENINMEDDNDTIYRNNRITIMYKDKNFVITLFDKDNSELQTVSIKSSVNDLTKEGNEIMLDFEPDLPYTPPSPGVSLDNVVVSK